MKSTTATCLSPSATARIEAFFPVVSAWGRGCLRAEEGECAALVVLEELIEEDAARLLSAAELEFFQQLRHPKRRREWLGGRIAAKAALLQLPEATVFEAQARRLTILRDAQGRPTVSGGAAHGRSPALSITHSGGYAAALTAQRQSCGIDLQQISGKILSLTSWFAAEEELKLLAEQPQLGSEAAALTMLWSVKEAMKKSLLRNQPGMFAGIKVEGIVPAGDCAWCFQCGGQAVLVHDFNEYTLALTC